MQKTNMSPNKIIIRKPVTIPVPIQIAKPQTPKVKILDSTIKTLNTTASAAAARNATEDDSDLLPSRSSFLADESFLSHGAFVTEQPPPSSKSNFQQSKKLQQPQQPRAIAFNLPTTSFPSLKLKPTPVAPIVLPPPKRSNFPLVLSPSPTTTAAITVIIPFLDEDTAVPSIPSVLSLNEDDIRFKEERFVEVEKLKNGTLKQQMKTKQSIRILEQMAERDKTITDALRPKPGVKPTLYFTRNARSASPRLKPIEPKRMKTLKQIAFLHSVSPINTAQTYHTNNNHDDEDDDTLFFMKDLISDTSLDLKPIGQSKNNNANGSIYYQPNLSSKRTLSKERHPLHSQTRLAPLNPSGGQLPQQQQQLLQQQDQPNIQQSSMNKIQNNHISNKVISEELSQFTHIMNEAKKNVVNRKKLHKQCRFKENHVLEFLSSLDPLSKEIDLSDTHLNAVCLKLLLNKQGNHNNKVSAALETLRLANTGLENESVRVLSNSLSVHQSLIILDVSNNSISNESCSDIKFIILSNPILRELYLSWNKFTAEGMTIIFDILTRNTSVRVLDVSNNSIGHGTNTEQKKVLETFDLLMAANTPLIHLDLRNNCILIEQIPGFKIAIAKNQTALGIHFSSGQDCYMDALNFLNPFEYDSLVQLPPQCEYFPIDSVKKHRPFRQKKYNVFDDFQIDESDNCWICEGWIEQEFTCTISSVSQSQWEQSSDMNVFLHLEIDRYRATTMKRRLEKDSTNSTTYYFTSQRMVPPKTQIKFFFSTDGHSSLLLSKTHNTVSGAYKRIHSSNANSSISEYLKMIETKMGKDFYKVEAGSVYVNTFNVIESDNTKPCVDIQSFTPCVTLKPRKDIYLKFQEQSGLSDSTATGGGGGGGEGTGAHLSMKTPSSFGNQKNKLNAKQNKKNI